MNSSEKPQKKIRIVFLIRSLFFGGAERQLLTLVKNMDRDSFDPIVLCFYKGGDLENEFLKTDVPIISLEKKGRWDVFHFFYKLLNVIGELQPEILHSYLSMSNILAVLVKGLVRRMKVVWGVRYAFMDLSKYDRLTRLVYKMEIWLSRFADLIIVNSYAGKCNHIRNGFSPKHVVVIPNGIDTERYYPSPNESEELRRRLGISGEVPVVGLVGRLDPVKDHVTFINAAARLNQARSDVAFLCVGDGDMDYLASLKGLAQNLGIHHKIHWLEGQKNVRAVYNSLNVYCSASIGESFSNVIAEAMACCIPCVVTDVGDSALIVGESGVVVPAGEAEAMAEGIMKILSWPENVQRDIGTKNRARINEYFSVDQMVQQTEIALINLTRGKNNE